MEPEVHSSNWEHEYSQLAPLQGFQRCEVSPCKFFLQTKASDQLSVLGCEDELKRFAHPMRCKYQTLKHEDGTGVEEVEYERSGKEGLDVTRHKYQGKTTWVKVRETVAYVVEIGRNLSQPTQVGEYSGGLLLGNVPTESRVSFACQKQVVRTSIFDGHSRHCKSTQARGCQEQEVGSSGKALREAPSTQRGIISLSYRMALTPWNCEGVSNWTGIEALHDCSMHMGTVRNRNGFQRRRQSW